MKKIYLGALLASTFISQHAFAQANNFEGFSVLGGLNVASNKLDHTSRTGKLDTANTTATNVMLEAQYAAALGNKFLLAGGIDLGVSDLNLGKAGSSDWKLKNNNSVFVKPSYALTDTTMVYGKVAALSARIDNGKVSDSVSGTGLGLGLAVRSGKNMYYQLEWMQSKYQDKLLANCTEKLGGNTLSFGVGYKF